MLNKKYQIFISSTFIDLEEERKAVQETILSMYQFPIGMEMFSAGDEEQWGIIKDTIDSSDYYVLIIAHRYGSKTAEGISYTEKEYQYAKMKGIPVLAFIINDSVPIQPGYMEKDIDSIERLELFKKDVANGRMVQWWSSKDELKNLVMNSLYKQFARTIRPGWVRANDINLEETQNELVQMSKKIRKLEEENEELKKQIIVRRPEIDVMINQEHSIVVYAKKYNINMFMADYLPIEEDDIPDDLKDKISEEEINDYNESLPNQEILDKYIEEMEIYTVIKENNYSIDIQAENIGKMKANDLRIQLEFPDEILIYKIKEVERLKSPKAPEKKENPIDKIRLKKSNTFDMFNLVRNYNDLVNYGDITGIRAINEINEDLFDYVEENILYINRKDLIHTRKTTIDNKYCLIPLKKGEFNIVCRIICEEFQEEVEQIIKIVVN